MRYVGYLIFLGGGHMCHILYENMYELVQSYSTCTCTIRTIVAPRLRLCRCACAAWRLPLPTYICCWELRGCKFCPLLRGTYSVKLRESLTLPDLATVDAAARVPAASLGATIATAARPLLRLLLSHGRRWCQLVVRAQVVVYSRWYLWPTPRPVEASAAQ